MGRVLIVDDEAAIAETIAELLTLEEHEPRCVGHGDLVLSVALVFRPAAILLDYLLPGLMGDEVAVLLRSHPETADVPILLMTAGGERARAIADAAGIASFLAKPFDLGDILDWLARVLPVAA